MKTQLLHDERSNLSEEVDLPKDKSGEVRR